MSVCANVIDISRYQPLSSDKVLVDTQVWLALAYPPKTRDSADEWRFRPYIAGLRRLRQVRATCYVSILSISEMASYIERSQYQIATKTKEFNRQAFKAWRNTGKEARERVWISLQACIQTIEDFGTVLPLPKVDLGVVIESFRQSYLDPIDTLLVQQAKAMQVSTILSDDRDFGSAKGLRVLTANRHLLNGPKPTARRDW